MMPDPHDVRRFGGVPIGNHVQPGTDRIMVQMQQPDGSMVLVPVELAILHVLAEIRTELQRARLVADMQTPAEVIAEVDRILAANQGGETSGANQE